MRPYVWNELSGAHVLKRKLDDWVSDPRGRSAYETVCDVARSTECSAFKILDNDLEMLSASAGLEEGHREMLSTVLRALVCFTHPPTHVS